MTRLIVNADDFGYTSGVNRAVVELYSCGALSSATLMAGGDALNDALARLHALPDQGSGMGIGCHVVLVDGRATAPAEQIPSLLDRRAFDQDGGRPAVFRSTLAGFVADLLRGRIREREIEREAVAQMRSLQGRGLQLTHVDTHKHTHMFPGVLRPLLRAALECGVPAVRNPFEPSWSLRATRRGSPARRAEVRLLGFMRSAFRRSVAEAGMATTAGAIGVLATGKLDAEALRRLLLAVGDPSNAGGAAWELVCHPGYYDEALAAQSTRLLQTREIERKALLEAVPLIQELNLIHFGSSIGEPRS